MTTNTTEADLRFGSFLLSTRRKVLLEGDRPVRLGNRAYDLLVALVERAGQVVSRRELEALVWPDTASRKPAFACMCPRCERYWGMDMTKLASSPTCQVAATASFHPLSPRRRRTMSIITLYPPRTTSLFI